MDAIKKKMQSLRTETDQLLTQIKDLEEETKASEATAVQCEVDTRDITKKSSHMESQYDTAFEQLIATEHKLEEKEKLLAVTDQDISSLCRRLTLLESEDWTAEDRLGKMTIDLANTCKLADDIQRRARQLESKCMNNEVNMEDLEKILAEARLMFSDSDKKLDESTRRLGMMEEELKRAEERANMAENRVKEIENELRAVGESMKALEVREEKALEREEKFKDQIRTLTGRLKGSESRTEYGEKHITKLNHRIDSIEDDIVREKLKIQRVSDELNGTLDDIFTKY
ncbi:hypothetical protein TCAL_06423 [Tigriopus californicus]|uniref:Tropomyosin n=1 Tax=Tigriopus californicus TaxID=6832 RepID=A0A553NQM1_TIGCA|nr:tropomyosin Cha f 1.0101-like [Tigriopus californicus]TRY67743.1 hypothetical protein TCAL_06423 [Tigriopus californicus]